MLQWKQWPSIDESACFMMWETLWQQDNQPKKRGKIFLRTFSRRCRQIAAKEGSIIGSSLASAAQRPVMQETRPDQPGQKTCYKATRQAKSPKIETGHGVRCMEMQLRLGRQGKLGSGNH